MRAPPQKPGSIPALHWDLMLCHTGKLLTSFWHKGGSRFFPCKNGERLMGFELSHAPCPAHCEEQTPLAQACREQRGAAAPAPVALLPLLTVFQLKCKQKSAHSLIRIQICPWKRTQTSANNITICALTSWDCTRVFKRGSSSALRSKEPFQTQTTKPNAQRAGV